MRLLKSSATILLAALLAAPAPPAAALGETAFAEIKGAGGKSHGRIAIVETVSGILLRIKLAGLPPGVHGFHIHDTGKCEGDFKSAGPIYNPLETQHGFLNSEGSMAGDLPNLIVPASGEIEIEVLSPFVSLSKDSEQSLFDADGASIVIFAGADDYTTQPEGKSGARIACGVITSGK